MIRVLVVDDHAVVRAGLVSLLATTEDIAVAGEARDGSLAVDMAIAMRPDIVLMDASMPGIDGVEAASRIVRAWPDARIVMLTSFADHDRVISSLDAGAVGYLLKDADPDELLRAIRAAAAGESPLSPRAANVLLLSRTKPAAASRADQRLSAREMEVLRHLHAGLANKQIAQIMGIAEKTVKAHLTSIFTRIGVADRTQAALWFERRSSPGPAA
jgi:DNA-binding NarL/FixJ family response regulator